MFIRALTDGQWVVPIRDTETGQIHIYQNVEGQLLSVSDTVAF